MKNLVSIEEYACAVFGDEILAQNWLSHHHATLGGVPKALILTEKGEREVRRVLACIESGIPV